MVLWGAFWGAVLGLLWPGGDSEFQMIVGGILGAFAGLSLRKAIRTAILEAQPVAQPLRAPPGVVQGYQDTMPREEKDESADLPEIQPAPSPRVQPEPAMATAIEPTPAPAPQEPPRPDFITVLIGRARDWLFGGNTVVRMGVVVLFIGLAFLAKYAVDNALLPPQLRLAAIAAAGIALFVFGFRMRSREDKLAYALTMQGAGVAVLYLTVFAAFRLYQFLPAGAAFAVLGLVCAFSAVIALTQNALPLAFIGFAGGFAAPILVSTGQGNHVALFSYYLLLNVAIAAIAWWKAWRPLNLLGFFATFGVATIWGVLSYKPQQFATTEPFLIAFYAVFLAASLFYALRHSLTPKQAVDATLIFGTPIVAFGLQAALVRDMKYAAAFSSLALGALYLGLGWWLVVRQRGIAQVNRWVAECFLALGLGFVTLAVPLALDGRWTSAVWAVEGAGVYWMGRRQHRWLPRAAGLTLQVMAAASYMQAIDRGMGNIEWSFANPVFIGATMLAGAALAIAWWSRDAIESPEASRSAEGFGKIELSLSPLWFWIGFFWWQFGLHREIGRFVADENGMIRPLLDRPSQLMLRVTAWVGTAFVLHHLALAARARPWPVAATPAWTALPVMLFAALWGMATQDHVFQSGGWAAWPMLITVHLTMLKALDESVPQRWWRLVHAGGVWLVVLLGGNLLVWAIGKAELWQTAWATVILLVAGSLAMLALASRYGFDNVGSHWRWPLDRFARSYLWIAAAPLAIALAWGALMVAVLSNGNAKPLPYVPLLNPTDLSVAFALAVCLLWWLRLRKSALDVPDGARGLVPAAVLGGIAFVALNTVWLRVAHHYAGVPWDANQLFASFLVQAGYSILWTLLALALMVGAHRRALRPAWMLGAVLLGVTVLKLFVIDLSNRGGTERIFVFIAVGLLMLVVGYFAPLPPARSARVQEAAP